MTTTEAWRVSVVLSVCSEAEAAKDRIAELEKESAARKSGWDRDTETWAAEKAALLEQMETRLAVEVREGANRMQAVTGELTAEYERLSDEHVALEREAKDLRAVSALLCLDGQGLLTTEPCTHHLLFLML